jgi:hypothetical protein
MKEGLPPATFRSGQDRKTTLAKRRAKGVESARYEDGICGGPKPADTFAGRTRSLEGSVKSAKITEQPSNQDRYGANREAIKRIRPFGKPVG